MNISPQRRQERKEFKEKDKKLGVLCAFAVHYLAV
jgi:hypothetical protein